MDSSEAINPAKPCELAATDNFQSRFRDLAGALGSKSAILASGREPLSFADLPSRIEYIRATLNGCGIGRGDRVAIVLPTKTDVAVCYIGVACCAVAVPLNPEYTEAEFYSYLERLRPATIILEHEGGQAARRAAESLDIALTELYPSSTAIGAFQLRPQGTGQRSVAEWNGLDDIALMLLTSGSTSRPKIVPQKQSMLLEYARMMRDLYRLDSSDRLLHTMPMFHGHGIKSGLTSSLLNGCSVICTGTTFKTEAFFADLAYYRPTWYSAGFTIHRRIMEVSKNYLDVIAESNLRFIRSGSGRLDPKVMGAMESIFNTPVLERYGMSETATLTSNPLPPGHRQPGTVGLPIGNEVAIMAADGTLLDVGQEGEIVARGPTVFGGYFDDPKATKEAFYNGWFRTGDLGRFDAKGYLTITGRLKDVINRGGEKIGTAEVENVLNQHPAVDEVLVFPISHPTLGEEVAGAVVMAKGQHASEQELCAYARKHLVSFKVPRRIYFLEELAKGPTGKIDRQSVIRQTQKLPTQDTAETQCALSTLAQDVKKIWLEVLGLDTISVHDDFFLLGGDSLKAMTLFSRMHERYGVIFSAQHIFGDGKTVAGMVRLLDDLQRSLVDVHSQLPAGMVLIRPAGDDVPLFLVPGSGGNPIGFAHLAYYMDESRPLYGIESRGLDGQFKPIHSMELIAADNISRIKALQAQGPYYLAGACFGARVAYEMARQLTASGDRVAMVIMLDPSAPFTNSKGRPRGINSGKKPIPPWQRVPRFVIGRLGFHGRNLLHLHGAARGAYLREKGRILLEMIVQRDLFRGDRQEINALAVYEANRAAGRAYLPGAYDGAVVVCFSALRAPAGSRNYRLDWLKLIPQCGEALYAGGTDSGEMLKPPHVEALAERMNHWLRG